MFKFLSVTFESVDNFPILYRISLSESGQDVFFFTKRQPPFFVVYPGPLGCIHDSLICDALDLETLKRVYTNFVIYTLSIDYYSVLENLSSVDIYNDPTIKAVLKNRTSSPIKALKLLDTLDENSQLFQKFENLCYLKKCLQYIEDIKNSKSTDELTSHMWRILDETYSKKI